MDIEDSQESKPYSFNGEEESCDSKADDEADQTGEEEPECGTSEQGETDKKTDTEVMQPWIKPKLCGAGRKRYRWFLSRGMDPEEARHLAAKPMSARYKRSSDSQSEPEAKRQKKDSKMLEKVKEETDVLKDLTVKIVHKNYPDNLLRYEQHNFIKEAITAKSIKQETAEADNEKSSKRFRNIRFRDGGVLIDCDDRETVEWIKTIVPDLQPWDEATLTVLEGKDPYRPGTFIGYFHNSQDESEERIMKLVRRQNQRLQLQTSTWKVIRRVDFDNRCQLVLSIDGRSSKKLRDVNCTINYHFNQMVLREDNTKTFKPGHIIAAVGRPSRRFAKRPPKVRRSNARPLMGFNDFDDDWFNGDYGPPRRMNMDNWRTNFSESRESNFFLDGLSRGLNFSQWENGNRFDRFDDDFNSGQRYPQPPHWGPSNPGRRGSGW